MNKTAREKLYEEAFARIRESICQYHEGLTTGPESACFILDTLRKLPEQIDGLARSTSAAHTHLVVTK